MQDEKAIEEVQKELQKGQKAAAEAEVPEDLLRARPPLLNGPLEALVVANRPVSDPGWRWSNVPVRYYWSGVSYLSVVSRLSDVCHCLYLDINSLDIELNEPITRAPGHGVSCVYKAVYCIGILYTQL